MPYSEPICHRAIGACSGSLAQPLPITPVSGTVETADSGAVESGTCEGGFWRVFGRGLQRPTGRADADAQFPGDDLPRGAGGSEAGYLARVDGDWLIAGAMGV
jgi:hypothetical protein